MYTKGTHKKNTGIWIIILFCLIGFAVSIYNFVVPSSGISHTAGAELVIITTIVMVILSLTIFFFRHLHARWERAVLYIIIILLLLGSIFAAYLLQSWILVTTLLVALIGWFIQVFTK